MGSFYGCCLIQTQPITSCRSYRNKYFYNRPFYNESSAREDCKKAGGEYIIVIDKGVTKTQNFLLSMRSNRTYTHQTETNYYGNYGQYLGKINSNSTYTFPSYDYYNIPVEYNEYTYVVYKLLPLKDVYEPRIDDVMQNSDNLNQQTGIDVNTKTKENIKDSDSHHQESEDFFDDWEFR